MNEKNIFTKEFKEAVISCLLQDKNFLKEAITILRPDYMDEEIYALAIDSIFKSYQANGELPSRAGLLNELVNGLAKKNRTKNKNDEQEFAIKPAQDFLDKIYIPLNGQMADVKEKWLHYCRTREMQGTILTVYKQLETGEIDHDHVMSEVRKTYLRGNKSQNKGVDFWGELDSLPADMIKIREKMYCTGFPTLDRKMGGGFTPGTLTTFIGAPKAGKSMTLINVGYYNLLRTNNVLYFTLEISEQKIRERFAARISGIPLNEMRTRGNEVLERCKEFRKIHKGNLRIKEYPTAGASVDTLKSYLYYTENTTGYKPDVIIIDYGDILRSSTKSSDSDERFKQKGAYEEMRSLASEFKCGVVTASQCNRGGVNKAIVQMNDIAESFAKVQISDHIITLCQTSIEEAEKKLRLYFAGSREAESGGMVPCRINWSTCAMIEIDKESKDSTNEDKNESDERSF